MDGDVNIGFRVTPMKYLLVKRVSHLFAVIFTGMFTSKTISSL